MRKQEVSTSIARQDGSGGAVLTGAGIQEVWGHKMLSAREVGSRRVRHAHRNSNRK